MSAKEQHDRALRNELHGYLAHTGERMGQLSRALSETPDAPATLGRLGAHIHVMQSVLNALARLDHEAPR